MNLKSFVSVFLFFVVMSANYSNLVLANDVNPEAGTTRLTLTCKPQKYAIYGEKEVTVSVKTVLALGAPNVLEPKVIPPSGSEKTVVMPVSLAIKESGRYDLEEENQPFVASRTLVVNGTVETQETEGGESFLARHGVKAYISLPPVKTENAMTDVYFHMQFKKLSFLSNSIEMQCGYEIVQTLK